jgi:hypothetical protein
VLELLSREYPIDTTGFEEQLVADAFSVNGEATVALVNGAATVMPSALVGAAVEVVGVDVVGAVVAVCETVMATSVTHTAPALPHALTCSVCAPVVAVTVASMELPFTYVVLLLLSSEKPISLTSWFEQLVAVAERVNCGATVAPFAGVLMVVLASAAIVQIASRQETRDSFLSKFTSLYLSGFIR